MHTRCRLYVGCTHAHMSNVTHARRHTQTQMSSVEPSTYARRHKNTNHTTHAHPHAQNGQHQHNACDRDAYFSINRSQILRIHTKGSNKEKEPRARACRHRPMRAQVARAGALPRAKKGAARSPTGRRVRPTAARAKNLMQLLSCACAGSGLVNPACSTSDKRKHSACS